MVKRTGPTKERAKQLVAQLEKAGKKGKSALWLDIAERLRKPRRQRPSVNLWKIGKLAGIFKGKSLLVPGKVLGTGVLEAKASVIALEFSEGARKKIEEKGGSAVSIEQALEKKVKGNQVVIVK